MDQATSQPIDIDIASLRAVVAGIEEAAALLRAAAEETLAAPGCTGPAGAALARTALDWTAYLARLRRSVAATAARLDGAADAYREAHVTASEPFAYGGRLR